MFAWGVGNVSLSTLRGLRQIATNPYGIGKAILARNLTELATYLESLETAVNQVDVRNLETADCAPRLEKLDGWAEPQFLTRKVPVLSLCQMVHRLSLVQIQIDPGECSSPRGGARPRRPCQDSIPSTLPKRSSSIPGRRGSHQLLCLGWE